MAKDKSIIRRKVKNIFDSYEASQNDLTSVYYSIAEMLFDIAEIADRSVHCESHRKILDETILKYFGE